MNLLGDDMKKTKSKVLLRYNRVVAFVNILVLITTSILVIKYFPKSSDVVILSQDLQYNMISLSATLAGFLFTGLSVLISVIDKKTIKPYWDGHYFTILTKTAFIGIILYAILLVVSVIVLVFGLYDFSNYVLIKIQLVLLTLATVNFIWCISEFVFLVRELKEI